MAFVPNYESDVFVSYSHTDNEAIDGQRKHGWVDDFIDEFTVQLRRRLGSRAVSVWTDLDLARNKPLTPELLGKVRASALLLVILSPSYVTSAWCERERKAFLELAQQRIADGRVFVVNYLDVSREQRPAELRDLEGHNFWIDDRELRVTRTLGEPDRAESEFHKRVYQLSVHVENALRLLVAEYYRKPQQGSATLPGREAVFLARATDDLEDREQELRNHLVQVGLRVPPRKLYGQHTREEFEAAVLADLRDCRAFAQVLSTSKGREMEFEEERRLPVLLFDLARHAGVPTLQWRDRAVDPSLIADARHRELVSGAIACPIEEFKRMVVESATRRIDVAAKRPPKVIVFVDRSKDDRKLAERAADALTRDGAQVYFPIDEGTPEEIRSDLEGALRDADGVLFVFGNREVASVRARLREHTKVLNQRDVAPAAIAVAEGPPGKHETLDQLRKSMLDPDLMIIDGAEGLSPEHLAPFIARLRNSHPVST